MAEVGEIIGLAQWLNTPAGRYLLHWEQAQVDHHVADIFGFHALQLGMPELNSLRANRMPHRWLAGDGGGAAPNGTRAGVTLRSASPDGYASEARPVGAREAAGQAGSDGHSAGDVCANQAGNDGRAVVLRCDFDALPFDSQSLDLVVLPHALELTHDPHQALREVERVLRPEGRVVILGFNPRSLWGLRQWVARCYVRLGAPPTKLFIPTQSGELIGFRRLRDWLRLLSFEVEAGRFGCYRPPLSSQVWMDRYAWADEAGERWWPVFGAVYCVVAVKRVRGMRLVGLARQERQATKAARPAVSHRAAAPTTQR